jgi:hypothetical protein
MIPPSLVIGCFTSVIASLALHYGIYGSATVLSIALYTMDYLEAYEEDCFKGIGGKKRHPGRSRTTCSSVKR